MNPDTPDHSSAGAGLQAGPQAGPTAIPGASPDQTRAAPPTASRILRCRRLGRQDYAATWQAMRDFTDARRPDRTPAHTPAHTPSVIDELWLLEHPPVFTLGQAARPAHLLAPGDIPVVQTDRGGQVTYHGPGQLIAYLLFDLRRAGIGVRDLVHRLEGAVIDLLADHGIVASARADAPGVYCDGAKIAALGLRVRHGCSYHGLALNLDLDLAPFQRIDPCGHPGLAVTRLVDLLPASTPLIRSDWEDRLAAALAWRLGATLT